MKRRTAMKRIFVLTVALLFSFPTMLKAAPADLAFYKGKIINYIVATKPGGGYDTYARLIGKYMQKYIPGTTVVIKNMPGAGHIIGANETYLSKPDGLTIGTFNTGLIYSQMLKQPGIRFDLKKYSWVGKASSDQRVVVVGNKTPYKTIKDIMVSKEPVKMAASGVGSSAYTETILIAEALGASNLKTLPGYSGREGEMAIMRGEVAGTNGAYTGLLGFIKGGECRVLLQIGAKKHKDLPNVPLASDLKLSPKGVALFKLIVGVNELGRLTGAPPNVPPGRLQVLRDAYKKAVTDPEFVKEAGRMGMDLEPGFGDEVTKLMKEAVNQPEENVTLLRSLIKFE
jgi:tripartite-type tricarboxylate transporter receptor subunit TctC